MKTKKLNIFAVVAAVMVIIFAGCEKEEIFSTPEEVTPAKKTIQIPTRIFYPTGYQIKEVVTNVFVGDSLLLSQTNQSPTDGSFGIIFPDQNIIGIFDQDKLTFVYNILFTDSGEKVYKANSTADVNLSDGWERHEIQLSFNADDLKSVKEEGAEVEIEEEAGEEAAGEEEENLNIVINPDELIEKDKTPVLITHITLETTAGLRIKSAKLTLKSPNNNPLAKFSGGGQELDFMVIGQPYVEICLADTTTLECELVLTNGDTDYETFLIQEIAPEDWEQDYIILPGQ